MPDCNSCKENRRDPVPYIVYESAMVREDRKQRRLVIIIVALALALLGTVIGFLTYLSQYDFAGYSQDGSGTNIVAGFGNHNEVNYHGTESQSEAAEEPVPGEGRNGS